MNKLFFLISYGFGALVLLSGCNGIGVQSDAQKPQVTQKVIVQKASKKDVEQIIKEEKLTYYNNIPDKQFTVYGEGIAPMNTISPAQAFALAKRAAVADAYRQLGEKLYGVQVNSKETVKDASLKDSRIETQVNGLIKNATITETSYKDGLFTVRMELTMSGKRWKEIFSY